MYDAATCKNECQSEIIIEKVYQQLLLTLLITFDDSH